MVWRGRRSCEPPLLGHLSHNYASPVVCLDLLWCIRARIYTRDWSPRGYDRNLESPRKSTLDFREALARHVLPGVLGRHNIRRASCPCLTLRGLCNLFAPRFCLSRSLLVFQMPPVGKARGECYRCKRLICGAGGWARGRRCSCPPLHGARRLVCTLAAWVTSTMSVEP